jgi:hypothetical protein
MIPGASNQLYLNISAMEPGDIVLTCGPSWLSARIADYGGGKHSHAAIYIGACHLLESLDGVIVKCCGRG